MRTAIATHELLPKGLVLRSLRIETGRVSICVSSGTRRSVCPLCGRDSFRVRSRYWRTVSDLPWHGISVELRAMRFFYDEPSCERKIFCERLEEVAARKTDRLEEALLAIALELGGRAGARLAAELGIVAARDALLRRFKAAPLPGVGRIRVLGVDDATGYRSVGHPNPRRFHLHVGIICAAGSLLVLLTDWVLHGLPDPDGSATARANRMVLDLFLPTSDLDAGVPPDAIILSKWVFTPMLMILVASWLTARLVARWCSGEVSET